PPHLPTFPTRRSSDLSVLNVALRHQTAIAHKSLNTPGNRMITGVSLWQITAESVGSLGNYHRNLPPGRFNDGQDRSVNFGVGHGDRKSTRLNSSHGSR